MTSGMFTSVQDPERLAALQRLALLDTPAEPMFDQQTRIVAAVLHVPVALISLVDVNRQFFKRLSEKVHLSLVVRGGRGVLEGAAPSNSPFSDSL